MSLARTPVRLAAIAGALALGLTLWATPVYATCGGGGGGGEGGVKGKDAYKTGWAGTLTNATEVAEAREAAVLLYFAAEGADDHSFFATKSAAEWSQLHRFVRIPSGQGAELRERYEVDAAQHVVHVCDWYGNSLKEFRAYGKRPLDARGIGVTLAKVKKLAKTLEKKLVKAVASAEKAIAKESYAAAIKHLAKVAPTKGYEASTRGKALLSDVETTGKQQLADALKTEDASARQKALKEIKKRFAGSEVELRAKEELEKASGVVAPAGERVAITPMGHDAWTDVLGSVDLAALAPTVTERVEAAIAAGLAAERAARYDDALVQYALASGLDLTDPVPLVYLGELQRHHLGQWDRAKVAFERALALGGSDFATAVAEHGIAKMTIWGGDNEAGLAGFARSLAAMPTPLCYRNLAVYWNTEGDAAKALAYATKAFELDRDDAYNQVFYSVYLLMDGQDEAAEALLAKAEFSPSMSYNYACFFAVRGERDKVLSYLKRHFYEYEQYDAVRSFEMGEARMDRFFEPWLQDPVFRDITALAGDTPWLREESDR